MNTPNPVKQISDAILYLAGRCDGAHKLDGAGFNGRDAHFGHSLADQIASGRSLSARQLSAALKVCGTYRKTQLAPAGLTLPTKDELDAALSSAYARPCTPAPKARVQYADDQGDLLVRWGFGDKDTFAPIWKHEVPPHAGGWDGKAWRLKAQWRARYEQALRDAMSAAQA